MEFNLRKKAVGNFFIQYKCYTFMFLLGFCLKNIFQNTSFSEPRKNAKAAMPCIAATL